jgi:transcription elongation factor GreB
MGRWRPPAAGSTALVTREGHDRLKAELDDLWRVRRPEVVKALAAAAAEGDRSENAEYTYRKKQLGEIDRRVRYLSKRLEALRVVEAAPSDRDSVFFGAEVTLENIDDGQQVAYRIVGPDETDARGAGSASTPRSPAPCSRSAWTTNSMPSSRAASSTTRSSGSVTRTDRG